MPASPPFTTVGAGFILKFPLKQSFFRTDIIHAACADVFDASLLQFRHLKPTLFFGLVWWGGWGVSRGGGDWDDRQTPGEAGKINKLENSEICHIN